MVVPIPWIMSGAYLRRNQETRDVETKPIPPADPLIAYKARSEAATQELESALMAAVRAGLDVAPYIARIRDLAR
jgi:hypothetical protein